MFTKIINWLVLSSKHPNEVGMTVKSTLLMILPVVSILLNLAHVNVGSEDLNILVDTIIGFLQGALAVVSALGIAWGFVRKIVASIKGTHVNFSTGRVPKL